MTVEPKASNNSPTWWKKLDQFKPENSTDDKNDLMQTWQGNATGHNVPEYGWRICLNHKFKEKRTAWLAPKLSQIPSLVGLSIRYLKFHHKLKRNNQRPCMDFLNQEPLRQIYGVPLGGIGGGSINRGWKGDFCRWQLRPGIYVYETTLADQFIVNVRKDNQTIYQQVLSIHPTPQKHLRQWKWCFPGGQAFYHALYPRAWAVYELPGINVVLTCRQISPVIPHDYKDSSIPAAVFSWTVENNSDDDLDISIAMTMENGIGSKHARTHSVGNYNKSFDLKKEQNCSGVVMHNFLYEKMPYTMTVAATENEYVKVTKFVNFDPSSTGEAIWSALHDTGSFADSKEKSHLTARGEAIACAVAASTTVKKKSQQHSIDFSLAWDMPQVCFGSKESMYRRRYTKFFTDDGNSGPPMALYALQNYPEWENKIEAWQNPILTNSKLPAWYKSAIFNELYYITDGGTVWVEHNSNSGTLNHVNANNAAPNMEDQLRSSETMQEFGRFAYLEGQEYRMFNTYDVHFYASIVLAALWPNLELSLQYDIAASILLSDKTIFRFIMDGDSNPVKTPGVVPHDVGDPDDEPWTRVNAYYVHDTASWKDLNPKFVLQVFRDYHITQNKKFLEDLWPICIAVMTQSLTHDRDGDGLIENSGTADQTFDGWSVTGPSAYCGGLWLAAIRCMVEASRILNCKDEETKYTELLNRAAKAYEDRLWNGEYFNYDSNENSSHNDSIMADQCAGQWYLLAANIADVIDNEKVISCLKKVYDFNVQAFANGKRGAVNGMRPNGKIDRSSVQSDEVWVGVTYAVAATMLHKGMLNEGFRTACGIYKSCWEELGMAFQTPEAIHRNSHYRSLAYMRPLSIWGMQYALENPKPTQEVPDENHK